MAQALGYVTKIETGGYEGTLSTMSLKKRIRIVPNGTKETDMQPDFRVYTEDRVEIGGGWNQALCFADVRGPGIRRTQALRQSRPGRRTGR